MGAIYKKELRSYVTSPVGYVVAAVLFALYGFYYYSVMLSGSTYYISLSLIHISEPTRPY